MHKMLENANRNENKIYEMHNATLQSLADVYSARRRDVTSDVTVWPTVGSRRGSGGYPTRRGRGYGNGRGEGEQAHRRGSDTSSYGKDNHHNCYTCGDPSHFSRDCSEPMRCFKCGYMGHLAVNCYSRQGAGYRGNRQWKRNSRGGGRRGTARGWQDAPAQPPTPGSSHAMVGQPYREEGSSQSTPFHSHHTLALLPRRPRE